MRQLETLRKRYDVRGQWFQIGLTSATLLTPLLKRWNDLRAAEQARAWRDEAEARLRDVRSWSPLQRRSARRTVQAAIEQEASARGNVSATIWLAGVGIGLVAAGTGAYFLVRRRIRQEREEPMLDLPMPVTTNGSYPREAATAVAEGIRQRDDQALSEAARNGATPMPAGASESPTASTSAPSQAGPLMPPDAAADSGPTMSGGTTSASEREPLPEGATTRTDSGAPAGIVEANRAAYVGNIHTMVYHAADADELPAEENRIYFASEDEAHDMGYRRARDEVSSGGE